MPEQLQDTTIYSDYCIRCGLLHNRQRGCAPTQPVAKEPAQDKLSRYLAEQRLAAALHAVQQAQNRIAEAMRELDTVETTADTYVGSKRVHQAVRCLWYRIDKLRKTLRSHGGPRVADWVVQQALGRQRSVSMPHDADLTAVDDFRLDASLASGTLVLSGRMRVVLKSGESFLNVYMETDTKESEAAELKVLAERGELVLFEDTTDTIKRRLVMPLAAVGPAAHGERSLPDAKAERAASGPEPTLQRSSAEADIDAHVADCESCAANNRLCPVGLRLAGCL